jgi:hypothetical protein
VHLQSFPAVILEGTVQLYAKSLTGMLPLVRMLGIAKDKAVAFPYINPMDSIVVALGSKTDLYSIISCQNLLHFHIIYHNLPSNCVIGAESNGGL